VKLNELNYELLLVGGRAKCRKYPLEALMLVPWTLYLFIGQ
jgi:hypothetical protein